MPTIAFNEYFPGYEILGELGKGNAHVMKARNVMTGELVAIKHFTINTDPETLRRFQRESEIMTAINHPNIVKIKEVRLEATLPYIVMELIEGGDLRSLLKQKGNLDIATTIRLGHQMVQAFKAIHENHIIHRDIKPENIMYRRLASDELHFLLSDFGIAKLREQSNTVTGTSMMTYEYASPEQFENPKAITAATDYYSMGIVLYECLSGHVPFILGDDGVYTFTQKVIHTLPPDLKMPGDIFLPRQLNALTKGLLSKKQEERIKDPVIVRRMLKQSELEELGDEPPPPPPRLQPAQPDISISQKKNPVINDPFFKSTDIQFVDYFNNNDNQWQLKTDLPLEASIGNGKLRMKSLSDQYSFHTSKSFDVDTNKDFLVSVSVRWIEGTKNSGFGIDYCADMQRKQHNAFLISQGDYTVSYTNKNSWEYKKPWTTSDRILTNEVNTLTIIKQKEHIKFFINGALVENLFFSPAFGTEFGLRVSQKQTVDFYEFIFAGFKKDTENEYAGADYTSVIIIIVIVLIALALAMFNKA